MAAGSLTSVKGRAASILKIYSRRASDKEEDNCGGGSSGGVHRELQIRWWLSSIALDPVAAVVGGGENKTRLLPPLNGSAEDGGKGSNDLGGFHLFSDAAVDAIDFSTTVGGTVGVDPAVGDARLVGAWAILETVKEMDPAVAGTTMTTDGLLQLPPLSRSDRRRVGATWWLRLGSSMGFGGAAMMATTAAMATSASSSLNHRRSYMMATGDLRIRDF